MARAEQAETQIPQPLQQSSSILGSSWSFIENQTAFLFAKKSISERQFK